MRVGGRGGGGEGLLMGEGKASCMGEAAAVVECECGDYREGWLGESRPGLSVYEGEDRDRVKGEWCKGNRV